MNYTNNTESPPKTNFVSNKTIQKVAGVTSKTVRRWAKEFGWKTYKINSRVIRYKTEDVEETLGISLA